MHGAQRIRRITNRHRRGRCRHIDRARRRRHHRRIGHAPLGRQVLGAPGLSMRHLHGQGVARRKRRHIAVRRREVEPGIGLHIVRIHAVALGIEPTHHVLRRGMPGIGGGLELAKGGRVAAAVIGRAAARIVGNGGTGQRNQDGDRHEGFLVHRMLLTVAYVRLTTRARQDCSAAGNPTQRTRRIDRATLRHCRGAGHGAATSAPAR